MLPSCYENEKYSKNSKTVKISNSLIEAFVKKNNLGALKILFYIASADIKLKKEELRTIKINVSDLVNYCNIDIKTLRRNIQQMQETTLTFVSFSDGVGEGASSPSARPQISIEENITVIPYSKYIYGGEIELKIFEKVLALVSEVKNRFTIIDLENLMKLKSKHSVRMIQLLEMIDGFSTNVAKRKTYTLFELNSMFGTNYSRLKEFERKIVIPVKDELDQMSCLSFVYQLKYEKSDKKAGRPTAVSLTVDLIS